MSDSKELNASPASSELTHVQPSREQVLAVISRRAAIIGMSNLEYFQEIIAGRLPRITRADAAREVVAQ